MKSNSHGTQIAEIALRIMDVVGPRGVITAPSEIEPYLLDQRRRYKGASALVVRPATTEEVARVVSLCAQARIPIVPQGGNTGLSGGAVPHADGSEIILSLARMTRIRAIDTDNDTMTVEAGCILAQIQAAAAESERLFPLSLAAEGSCQIGGNLSTNAGGVSVLRYGNARDLVLGLEVVLPDGRVWEGLSGLRKDNTGYDLKHLFIGAEGTLGIITAAVLKLFPKPKAKATALVAVPDPESAVRLLRHTRASCGDRLTAFEVFSRLCLEFVLRHIPQTIDPFPQPYRWYILAELADTLADSKLEATLENTLAAAIEQGIAADAVCASSEAQAGALWRLREAISEAQRPEGASIKHDVSVPVSRIPQFIHTAGTALNAAFPGTRILAFGHIGDGNIHYNLSRPEGTDDQAFHKLAPAVNRIVYDIVASLQGSISAEHGLGQLKRETIARYKSALELELMRGIKRTFDPEGLMNPGKVLP